MTQHQSYSRSPAQLLIDALDELSFQICWALTGGGCEGDVAILASEDDPVLAALERVREALVLYRHPHPDVTGRV